MGYAGNAARRKYLQRVWHRKWVKEHPEYKEQRRKYRRKHRKMLSAYNREWYQRKSHHAKRRKTARMAVWISVKMGFLAKPKACEICHKKKRLQGHHHLGYATKNWIKVKWLCASCHNYLEPRNIFTKDEKRKPPRVLSYSEASKIRWEKPDAKSRQSLAMKNAWRKGVFDNR
jgi:hypothetical protein